MNYKPKYDLGYRFRNELTGNVLVVKDREYSEFHCCIIYDIQHLRYKFDMRKLPEPVITHNLERDFFTEMDEKG